MPGFGSVPRRVLASQPFDRFVYTFNEDWILSWQLSEEGSGTRFLLNHAGFDLDDKRQRDACDRRGPGWRDEVLPNREEFRQRMQGAIEAYEKAHDFYETLVDGRGTPWMLRCRAVSKDLSYWLTSDPSEKRRLLDECLELEEMALKAFWDLGNKLEYGRTYN